jgi:hypothetical protein
MLLVKTPAPENAVNKRSKRRAVLPQPAFTERHSPAICGKDVALADVGP